MDIPEPNLETVLLKIRSVFPDRPEQDVLRQLEAYGRESHEREPYRVYLAILKLCEEEGLEDPGRYIEVAKRDYRDVLAWAEYPNQMQHPGAKSPEAEATLQHVDRLQYARWLGKASGTGDPVDGLSGSGEMRAKPSRRPHSTPARESMNKPFEITRRLRSFHFAFAGVWTLLTTQHNAWIHALATVAVVGCGFCFDVSAAEWCWLVLAIASVWTAEAFNTAFEFLADAVSPGFHPLVGQAKDVAAAAVLISAIGAAVIGVLVFWPHGMALVR